MASILNVDVIKNAAGTGAPSFTNGIAGTTTNDSAAAGMVGETIRAGLNRSAALTLTTAVPKTIVSIALSAGDWDVRGIVGSNNTGNNITGMDSNVSLTTDAQAPVSVIGFPTAGEVRLLSGVITATADATMPIPSYRVSLSGSTTLYLTMSATFGAGTGKGYGWIEARRIR